MKKCFSTLVLLLFYSFGNSQALTCSDFPEITASSTNLCVGLSTNLSVNYTPPTICNMNITPSNITLGNPIPGFTYSGLFNGHYYYVYNTPTSWTQGELICRQNGGYLVCINDINENTFVSNSTNNNIWIGMFRDPITCVFRWLDCMDITFTNWRPGEPNSGPCGEPYAQIIRGCTFGLNSWNNLDNVSANGACYSNMVPIMEIDPAIYNTPINAATTYLWSTGETTATISVTPSITSSYWVDITSGSLTCRKNITINVGPSIAPSANLTQTFCGTAVLSDLVATGTTIQWYSSANGGLPLATNTTLIDGGTYYATQTINGCESLTRTLVTVILNALPPAPTGNSAQSFCNTATIADIIVTGTSIQWYSSSTGGTALPSNTPLVDGSIYYASQSTNGCESTTRLQITVSINNPQINTTSNTICIGGSTTLTASNTNNTISNTCSLPSNLQNGLVGYWPFCGNSNDESGNGNNGTVNGATLTTDRFGNANNAYSFDGNDYIETNRVNLNSFTVNVWLNLASFNCFSALIDAYPSSWEFLTDCNTGTNLASAIWNNSLQYQIYQSNYLVPVNTWTQVAMTYENNVLKIYANGNIAISTATISVTNINGFYYFGRSRSGTDQFLDGKLDDISIWNRALTQQEIQQIYNQSVTTYLWSTGETTASINPSPTNTTTYWVDVTTNNVTCRKYSTIYVTSTALPVANTNQAFCYSGILADLVITGTTIQWYDAAIGGNLLPSSTALVNGVTYYASQTLNGCESLRVPVTVIINIPLAPTGTTTQSFCNAATIADIIVVGTSIQWYSSSTGGTALPTNTPLVNGSIYYASQSTNGCESLNRLAVTAVLLIPAAPTGSSNQIFCYSDNPTVVDLQLNQTNVLWYSSLVSTTPLNINTLLINGNTYYASQLDSFSSCESIQRFAVTVTLINPPIPSGLEMQQFCIENSPTIGDLILNSNALIWYDSYVNGTILPLTHILSNGEVVYAEGFDATNNCHSISRFQVEVSIINTELKYYNLITVNNNSSNYKLTIDGIERFPQNEIQIFNRYGEMVWNSMNYNNTTNYFIGKANVNGVYMKDNYLPSGTYYFVVKYVNPCEKQELKGFFQIDNNN